MSPEGWTERDCAVASWLLSAAPDLCRARAEWDTAGVALLPCGSLFSAVRLRADLVHAAAGSTRRAAVDACLAEVLRGGPIFSDRYGRRYYALVPPGEVWCWTERRRTDVSCLSRESYLGVPAPWRTGTDCGGRSYWCVPVAAPGRLCAPRDVMALVRDGRSKPAPAEDPEEVEDPGG